jgi:integrase
VTLVSLPDFHRLRSCSCTDPSPRPRGRDALEPCRPQRHRAGHATELGKPLHLSNFLRRSFYPLLERPGLPRIRFHDLRHSAATLLLDLGIHPKIVSELLGHSQIAITLDLYSHVTATMQQEAVRAFEGLFGSQEGATEQ